MEKFTTVSTSLYSQKVLEPVIIEETATTRRVFIADINDRKISTSETVSGTIIHQRKNNKNQWENVDAINLATLKSGEGIKIKLDSSQTRKLYEGLTKLYELSKEGVVLGTNEYVVSNVEDIIHIPEERKDLIKALIQKDYGEEIWSEIISSDPDLATKLSLARIHAKRKTSLDEFERSLKEDKEENYWQEFFFQNQWIFGYGLDYKFIVIDTDQPSYGGINFKGTGNQKGDFLSHSKGGINFTILIEIKKPQSPLLAKTSQTKQAIRYRNGAWLLGSELLGGVIQLQTNCKTWQRTSAYPENINIENEGTYTINPKGILVIGLTEQFKDKEQIESFENFRRSLSNIEIITFDELFERAKFILEIDDKSKLS